MTPKEEYVCVMEKVDRCWQWYIRTYNGHTIIISEWYFNKAQCRNVGKKFAEKTGLKWVE